MAERLNSSQELRLRCLELTLQLKLKESRESYLESSTAQVLSEANTLVSYVTSGSRPLTWDEKCELNKQRVGDEQTAKPAPAEVVPQA